MNISVRHLIGIDQALGMGAEVKFDGKTHTFSPLTFKNYAEVVAHNKSQALAAYLAAPPGMPMKPGQRIRDINGIMCRPTLEGDFAQGDPETLLLKCKLSLRKKHPAITDSEVDALLSNDEWRELICEVMHVVDNGPIEFTDGEQEDGESTANPT